METINHAQRDGVATTSTVQPVPAISTQPESSSRQHLSEEEAAVTLQKHWRGYQTRHAATKMSTSDRWDDLKRAAEDKQYAEDQLDNRNDVKSRWHRAAQAAARMEHGDGLRAAPVPASHVRPRVVLDEETRKARRATFWGTLSKGVGKERDENEILPYQSKSLEQQHW
ncbi:hypothetical protein BD324DRAFT_639106 [Kockovaella imperatae]|uniref:Uncharacterized protein n=1 Tax=Kockovaella imperatae TaxID=4999 RepID=A0A1Y1U6K3_9TREE|nr:hypothetical protein BD324DRAFT_639106 [Kockovaella imperatae]ORX33661.1 hypothetical protein BD324DRAFT_639106 [Kockovaella imperatae]